MTDTVTTDPPRLTCPEWCLGTPDEHDIDARDHEPSVWHATRYVGITSAEERDHYGMKVTSGSSLAVRIEWFSTNPGPLIEVEHDSEMVLTADQADEFADVLRAHAAKLRAIEAGR